VLFQRPKRNFGLQNVSDSAWFENKPLGKNSLGDLMCCNHGIFSSQCSCKQKSRLFSYFLLSALVVTFSCFRFTPGLAFGGKDIGHPAITEYLSLTGQGKLRNRKLISERKRTFYGNSLPVRRTDKESILVGLNIF